MFYAVRAGKKPGVYTKWDECAAQVLAFKGAAFKKFSSREAAEAYVNPLKCLQDSAKTSQNIGNTLTDASIVRDTSVSEPKVKIIGAVTAGGATVRAGSLVVPTRGASVAAGSATAQTPQTGRFMSDMRHVDREASPPNANNFSIYMYTDGSCLSNKDVAHKVCPAGWAVVVVNGNTMEIEAEIFAAVAVDKSSSSYLGALVGSNNTAEVSAIGEAFRWLINSNASTNPHPRVCIRYDSEYAAKSIQGIFNGEKNADLIANVRRLYRQASVGRFIVFEHVKGHSNEKFNSRADVLAKRGASGESSCFTEQRSQLVDDEFPDKIRKRKRDEP
jgi:ribonuclease HI